MKPSVLFLFILLPLIVIFSCKQENEKNHLVNGIEKLYYKNGNLKALTTFKNGKKNGTEKLFYENGNLEMECVNFNDKLVGSQTFYFKNGNPRVYNLIDGIGKGVFKRKYSKDNEIKSNQGVSAILISEIDWKNFYLEDKFYCGLLCANPPDSKTRVRFEIKRDNPFVVFDDYLQMDSTKLRPIELEFSEIGIEQLIVIGEIEDSVRNSIFIDSMLYSLNVKSKVK